MLTDSDETHSSSVTSQQCFKAIIKLWFYCIEHKVRKSLLAKEDFNCKGLSRDETKKKKGSKMEHSSLHVLDSILRQPSQVNGCRFLPLQGLILLFKAFLALSTGSWY